jgi:RHS repeat-associated protein
MARRVAKKVDSGNWKWYFYDGLKVIVEGTATNSRTYYTNSPAAVGGIITDGGSWFHYDRLGNVVAQTGSDGAPTYECTMDAFGNVLQTGDSYSGYLPDSAGTGGGYHLTTKEFDSDSGLYYFNARWYDPTTGRFASKSPIPVQYEHPFLFCAANPARYTDVTGLTTSDDPCPKKKCEAKGDPDMCLDWGNPHPAHWGETCYRTSGVLLPIFGGPSRHCCYDKEDNLVSDHVDYVGPGIIIDDGEAGKICIPNPIAIPPHIVIDVFPWPWNWRRSLGCR